PRLVGLTQRDERATAALDEERGTPAEQDDVRTGDACRSRTRSPRPGQHGPVRLSRVGCGEDERLVGILLRGPQLTQPLDRPTERELRPTEPLDEVTPAAEAERLERPQLAV